MLQIFKGKNFTQQIFKVQTAVCAYFIMQSQRSDSRQTLQACVMWLVSWRVTRCPHLIRCHLFCCSAPLMLLLLCMVNADLVLLCTLTATLLVFCNPTTSPAATSQLCFSDLLRGSAVHPCYVRQADHFWAIYKLRRSLTPDLLQIALTLAVAIHNW